MNSVEKHQLEKIVRDNDYQNNTSKLRQLKHSKHIKDEINIMQNLKITHAKMREIEPDKFYQLCSSKCYYLFTVYNFLFKKLYEDQLSIHIMNQLLETLDKVENGSLDQHEGSVEVGKILKTIYIDTKIQDVPQESTTASDTFVEPIKVSWKEFKNNQ